VRQELQKTAPVEIDVEPSLEGENVNIHTTVRGVDGSTSGKLQLWIVEDNITAFQMMPDGTRNMEYIHRHVFRAAINGTWGESVSVAEGETFTTKDYLFNIPEGWNADRLSVVAFVYNDQGVLQAKILHNIK
jgi:hypothetical protein